MSTLADFGAEIPDREPWKDEDVLQELYHDQDLNQSEIAEYFSDRGNDVTPPTISYWMNKLEINTSHTDHSDDERVEHQKCDNFEECGNKTPGPYNRMCDDCLDEARHND